MSNIFWFLYSKLIKPPIAEELAQHVPRNDNSAADAAANWALDNGSFFEVRASEVVTFIHELAVCKLHNIGLLFSFDGAARGNPGPSSSGVCAWWGCFSNGQFQAKGLLIQRGTRLGTSTNNTSEAHGLASAVKTCLRYFCWVSEQLVQLAQQSMRQG